MSFARPCAPSPQLVDAVEEGTYRWLAAAHAWATTEADAVARITGDTSHELSEAPTAPDPSAAEVRAWARATGMAVPDRGRLRPDVWDAWRTAHPQGA